MLLRELSLVAQFSSFIGPKIVPNLGKANKSLTLLLKLRTHAWDDCIILYKSTFLNNSELYV